MTCLYEATIDDLVMAFMHIANCRPWLGSSGKGHDSTSSKLKVASGSYEVFSKGKIYEQCGLCLGRLGSIWVYEWKLNLPPDSHCDLHQHDNVNHCILCPNTHVKRACIEQSLNVANMMQLIWHPCWRLVTPFSNGTLQDCRPTLQRKKCWALQANIGTLTNTKAGTGKHGTHAPMYKEMKKEFRSANNVEYDFWFCHDDINGCVNGNKKTYVLDWPMVPNMWMWR